MKSRSSLLMPMATMFVSVFTAYIQNDAAAFSICGAVPFTVAAFQGNKVSFIGANPKVLSMSSSASDIDGSSKTASSNEQSSPIEFVRDLLSTLSSAPVDKDVSSKGQCLLDASSDKWREAIYLAIGAPLDVKNTQGVAQALQDAMMRKNNQFAILMGSHASMAENDTVEPYVATFPSDVVDYRNDGTAWLECRLRHATSDELLVTMGIQLVMEEKQWKILSLDWQDFRPQFYPGLSGREWLRSF